MPISPNKDLSLLDDSFRQQVKDFLAECPEIFITEGWRSDNRQKQLLKLKLSKTPRSLHQDGLAIDIAFKGDELYPTDLQKWRKVADIAKKHGIDWGFDLWQWDKPHFQKSTKITNKMQNTLEEILFLLKDLYGAQKDEMKIRIAQVGIKIRDIQKALQLPITK